MMTELIVTLRNTNLLLEQLSFCKEKQINNFRINLARGNKEKNINLFNTISEKIVAPKFYVDLPGMKSRIESLENELHVLRGMQIILQDINKSSETFENYQDILLFSGDLANQKFNHGDRVIFGDHNLECKVSKTNEYSIVLQATSSGDIKSKSGFVNIDSYIPNEKVLEDEIEYIELLDKSNVFWDISFSDTISRLKSCKSHINYGGVISKIESSIAVKNLQELCKYCDGLMLARGDLGNFYSDKEINNDLLEKISKFSGQYNLQFITATGYFDQIAKSGIEDKVESNLLRKTLDMKPDFLITNETSYSSFWKEIISLFCSIRES